MSHNSFGHLFRVTTFGESHGAGIGCVVDGCPPLIALEAADIQADLDRRRPGTSRFTTQRREPDEVKILSGVMVDERIGQPGDDRRADRPVHRECRSALEGLRRYQGQISAPATPISPMRRNTAFATIAAAGVPRRARRRRASPPARSRARSSREWRFAARWCRSASTGSIATTGTGARFSAIPFFCPDAKAAALFESYLDGVRKAGSSVGAVIEIVAEGAPAGWGAPIYGKLDSEIASALDEHQRRQGRRNRRGLCGR